MASLTLMFLNSPGNIVLSRSLKNSRQLLRKCLYSSSKVLNKEEKPPKKFSSSLAAKITIKENLGLGDRNLDQKFQKAVVISSISLFLLYFCVIREENDLDEILSGNYSKKSIELELVDLKMKLYYCEQNHLPTYKIRARIQEIVDQNSKPVFAK